MINFLIMVDRARGGLPHFHTLQAKFDDYTYCI